MFSRWKRTSAGGAASPGLSRPSLEDSACWLSCWRRSASMAWFRSVTGGYREIGIRMALGSGPSAFIAMTQRQTMIPVVAGAIIGVAAASALSGILSSVPFGISPADPIGLGGAALLVTGVSLAAGVMAAMPATRIEPTAALRHE